jgi:malic enzyme
VKGKMPVKTRDDLSMAYTPGVARICMAIHHDPEKAYTLTIKQNTVAVVTDGSAVLGLGDIGPSAAQPVMEGKALIFKEFAGVDAFPICLATKDVRSSAASTSRTSRRRAASRSRSVCSAISTSPCSTTTSTAPRWWCWGP